MNCFLALGQAVLIGVAAGVSDELVVRP